MSDSYGRTVIGRPNFHQSKLLNNHKRIVPNTLYLLTPGSYASRDHLTLQIEAPVYPDGLPAEQRDRKSAVDLRKLSVPIHQLESIRVFGPSTISPAALDICWEHGLAVSFLSEHGCLQARTTGVADTSVTLRRAHFRVADDAAKCAHLAANRRRQDSELAKR